MLQRGRLWLPMARIGTCQNKLQRILAKVSWAAIAQKSWTSLSGSCMTCGSSQSIAPVVVRARAREASVRAYYFYGWGPEQESCALDLCESPSQLPRDVQHPCLWLRLDRQHLCKLLHPRTERMPSVPPSALAALAATCTHLQPHALLRLQLRLCIHPLLCLQRPGPHGAMWLLPWPLLLLKAQHHWLESSFQCQQVQPCSLLGKLPTLEKEPL